MIFIVVSIMFLLIVFFFRLFFVILRVIFVILINLGLIFRKVVIFMMMFFLKNFFRDMVGNCRDIIIEFMVTILIGFGFLIRIVSILVILLKKFDSDILV